MASHIKGYITALLSVTVLTFSLFSVNIMPDAITDALKNPWVLGIVLFVGTLLMYLVSDLVYRTANAVLCFFWQAFIFPILAYISIFYSLDVGLGNDLSANIFTSSSLIAAIGAVVVVLFFAIIYSAMKENVGFARIVFIVVMAGLIFGVYALFEYALKGVIEHTSYIVFYAYTLLYFYLINTPLFELCEECSFYGRSAGLVSIIKRV